MESFGEPLLLRKRPRLGFRAQRVPLRDSMVASMLGRNTAASKIQRAYGKYKRRGVRQSLGTRGPSRTGTGGKQGGNHSEEGPANSVTYTNFGNRTSFVDPILLKISGAVKHVQNDGYQITCGTGVQAVSDLVFMNNADLLTCLGYSPYNPIASDTVRMYIESVTGEYVYSNQSAATAIATIYDVQCKRDLSSALNFAPRAAWLQGVTDEGVLLEMTTVGAKPYDVMLFNSFWKVIKTHKIMIPPGGVHRHRFTFKPHTVYNGAVAQYATYGSAGLTSSSMIVWHGQPAHDSTTKTQVTTAPVNMDVTRSLEYTVKFIQNNVPSVHRTNNLVAAFTVGEELFNEDVGQLQNAAGLAPGTLVG